MFFGQCVESKLSEVKLQDTPLEAFKQLLRYLYTAKVRPRSIFFNRSRINFTALSPTTITPSIINIQITARDDKVIFQSRNFPSTFQLSLDGMDDEDVTQLLGVAQQYGIGKLTVKFFTKYKCDQMYIHMHVCV
jgi:hypothetical protein